MGMSSSWLWKPACLYLYYLCNIHCAADRKMSDGVSANLASEKLSHKAVQWLVWGPDPNQWESGEHTLKSVLTLLHRKLSFLFLCSALFTIKIWLGNVSSRAASFLLLMAAVTLRISEQNLAAVFIESAIAGYLPPTPPPRPLTPVL